MQVIADPPGGGESFSKGEEGRYLRWGGGYLLVERVVEPAVH